MKKEFKKSNIVLTLLTGYLASCLTACATHSETIVKTQILPPPKTLVTPCNVPKAKHFETNNDVIMYLSSVISSLEQCAAQIEGIREFYEISDSD